MPKWVVLLQTAEGTQTILLDADAAEVSEDGSAVRFSNFGTLIEAYQALEQLEPDVPRDHTIENVRRLIRALSRFSVGSFRKDAVLGYYQTEDANLE
jgi:hypothetical protein